MSIAKRRRSKGQRPAGLLIGGGIFALAIGFVVASSFRREVPPSFAVAHFEGQPADGRFVTDTVTIDARDGQRWTYFDFDQGSVTEAPGAGWDLAVSRYHVVVNGGPGYAGAGGAIASTAAWDAVIEAPASGYTTTVGALDDGAATPALERWYQYGFFSHVLQPKDETYIIRTAEGGYAKLRMLSYYCSQTTSGCLTFLYGFQGDGSRRLTE